MKRFLVSVVVGLLVLGVVVAAVVALTTRPSGPALAEPAGTAATGGPSGAPATTGPAPATGPPAAAGDDAVVARLVDGDTFVADLGGRTEKIRLLNVDTPETKDPREPVGCLGPEASAYLASLIPVGTPILLEYDDVRTDRYGRTLAGVRTADGRLVNAEIARAGFGTAVVFDGNERFLPPVRDAEREALTAARGLHAPDACGAG